MPVEENRTAKKQKQNPTDVSSRGKREFKKKKKRLICFAFKQVCQSRIRLWHICICEVSKVHGSH